MPRCGWRRRSPGPASTIRGPNQSRVDLRGGDAGRRQRPDRASSSASTGSTRSRCSPCSTAQIVERGDLVASVKVAPHVVDGGDRGRRRAPRRRRGRPLVWVAPFIAAAGRRSSSRSRCARRRASGSRRASGPRSRASARAITSIVYVDDDPDGGRGGPGAASRAARTAADLVLTAGGREHRPGATRSSSRSTRSAGASCGAACRPIRARCCGWRGSARTAILGLPTCGAYSKATAADLLLPRLLSGEPRVGADRRQARPRRHPDPGAAVPLPAVRPGARRARWLRAAPSSRWPATRPLPPRPCRFPR